jgi:hypothetical protein
MIVRAKAPSTALKIPKRKRNPSTNQAAILKHTTAIINVKMLDNKSKVSKFGTVNKRLKIGLTTAVTIPRNAAEKKAFCGESISTPKGSLVIINKLIDVTTQTIKSVTIFMPQPLKRER